MEKVHFVYDFNYDGNRKSVSWTAEDKADEGLNCSKVCEAFLDFMRSIGFSEDNIFSYFNN